MEAKRDKYVIECWLRLYNRLMGASFVVACWPDDDSSDKNIDALCRDDSQNLLAIEHTLIQPFEAEKTDTVRFLKTLASLENHVDLVQSGYAILASMPVSAVPTGVDWTRIRVELMRQLQSRLPTLPEGSSSVVIAVANCAITLRIEKKLEEPGSPGKFCAERVWPGDPGPSLVIRALEEKVPKLSAYKTAKRILLLEQEATAGTTEGQFERLPDDPRVTELLGLVDEVWSAKTAWLESEGVILGLQIWPSMGTHRCSLELRTGRFWRGPR